MVVELAPSKDDWLWVSRDGQEFRLSYMQFINEYQDKIDPNYTNPNPILQETDLFIVNRGGTDYVIPWSQMYPETGVLTLPPPPPETTDFDPLSLAPELWLDAADEVTVIRDIIQTELVVEWQNKGTLGASANATPTVAVTNSPRFVAEEQNGLPGIWFNRLNHPQGNGGPSVPITNLRGAWAFTAGQGTVIMCMKAYAGMHKNDDAGAGGTNKPRNYQNSIRFSLNSTSLRRWDCLANVGIMTSYGGGSPSTLEADMYAHTAQIRSYPNEVEVVGSVIDNIGDSLYIFVNQNESETVETNFTGSYTQYNLMEGPYSNDGMAGVVYEVLAWDRTLTPSEIDSVREYLYAKWQVPYAFGRPTLSWTPNTTFKLLDTDYFYAERANGLGYRTPWADFKPKILNLSFYRWDNLGTRLMDAAGDQLIVDWGDGTVEELGLSRSSTVTHNYPDYGWYNARLITSTPQRVAPGDFIGRHWFSYQTLVSVNSNYGFPIAVFNPTDNFGTSLGGIGPDNGYRQAPLFVQILAPWRGHEYINDRSFMHSRAIRIAEYGDIDWSVPPNTGTNYNMTFASNWFLKVAPLLNTAGVTQMRWTFGWAMQLKTLPLDQLFQSVTDAPGLYAYTSIEEVPAYSFPNLISAAAMFYYTRKLQTLGALNMPNVANLESFLANSAITNIPAGINFGALVTNMASFCAGCTNLAFIAPGYSFPVCTNVIQAFQSTRIANDPEITFPSATNWYETFIFGDVSRAWFARFEPVWNNVATNVSQCLGGSFTFLGTNTFPFALNSTSITSAGGLFWDTDCNFNQPSPSINLPNCTFIGSGGGRGQFALSAPWTTLNNISLPKADRFINAFRLATISSVGADVTFNSASGVSYSACFDGCSNLSSFNVNCITGLAATNFSLAWRNCALNQTSVDNILATLNANGASNGTVNLNGGTSATPTGGVANPDVVALASRGWTVVFN